MVNYRRHYTKINKIGIEIEGEFSDPLYQKLLTMGVMKSDGSVNYCRDYEHKKEVSTAEYNSLPFLLSEKIKLKKILGTFQKAYSTGDYHFNKSAGMHIHISFSPKRPPELLSTQFIDFFLLNLKKKLPEVLQIRQNNSFCKINETKNDWADKEILSRNDRYKAINFLPSLSKHGTVEFRIFPTNEPDRMYEYILFTVKTIQNFLKKTIIFKQVAEIAEIEPINENYNQSTTLLYPLNEEFNFSVI